MQRGAHAVAWVVLALAAFLLWPERWGGSMTYVITSGVSMQPAFVQGDLAILRSSSDYQVGDVAAYDSPELKKIVMHRITKETDEGYAFQGDNNDFLDPALVAEDQVLGKLVLRVPGVGRWLSWLLQPVNLVLAAGALFLLMSDRKKDALPTVAAPAKAPLGRIEVASLDLPPFAVTADVVSAEELDRVAAHYDRPVLQIRGQDRRYVVEGSVVYLWTKAELRSPAPQDTAGPRVRGEAPRVGAAAPRRRAARPAAPGASGEDGDAHRPSRRSRTH